jgi:autotransporter-associated beta strand protein
MGSWMRGKSTDLNSRMMPNIFHKPIVEHVMIRRILLSAAIGFLFPIAIAMAASVQEVVNEVDQSAYADFHANSLYTHTGNNRGINGPQHDLARNNIYNTFANLGLNPVLNPFTYNSSTYYNVVATLPGAVNPSEVYIVGAHYDSTNNPGADDNASGTAGVIELARVLSRHRFDATIVFIAFDREEQGMIGSKAYANAHALDDIHGMVSLDMIAYNPAGIHHDKAIIYGRTASNPIKNDLAAAITSYGNGLTYEIGGDLPYSDHAPFEAKNKQACLLIEHALDANPYYHSSADSVDTPNYIDYTYATNMTRSVAGWLATEAALIPIASGTWKAAGSGNWDNPANWNGAIPQYSGDSATFGSAIATSSQVTLDNSKTIGNLTFQNINSYAIVPGSGSGTLVLSGTGATAPVTVLAGSHSISTEIALSSNVSLSIAANCSLNVSGDMNETRLGMSLTKTGAGRLVLGSNCSYTGPTNIHEGSLELNGGDLSDNSVISVANGATLKVTGGTVSLGIIDGEGTTVVTGNDTILTVQSITQSALMIGVETAFKPADGVTVSSIPEPSTLTLFGMGIFGWFASTRRRK